MSRIVIDAGGRRVEVDHEGELAHLTQAARDLWDHTTGAVPDTPGGAIGFISQQRSTVPVSESTMRYGPARVNAQGGPAGEQP